LEDKEAQRREEYESRQKEQELRQQEVAQMGRELQEKSEKELAEK